MTLDDGLPCEEGSGGSNLATLAILYRLPEAAALVSMLRAQGIPAFIPTWAVATMYWDWTVAIGGVAVLVPRSDLATAIDLVGDPNEIPPPAPNFRGGRVVNIFIALAFGLLPILMLGTYGLILPPRARGSYARPARA